MSPTTRANGINTFSLSDYLLIHAVTSREFRCRRTSLHSPCTSLIGVWREKEFCVGIGGGVTVRFSDTKQKLNE